MVIIYYTLLLLVGHKVGNLLHTCRTVAGSGQIAAQQWNFVWVIDPILGVVHPTANSISLVGNPGTVKGILGRPHLPEPVLVRDISSRVGHIQDTLVPQLAHVHLAIEMGTV